MSQSISVEIVHRTATDKAPAPTTEKRLREQGKYMYSVQTPEGCYSSEDFRRLKVCREIDRLMSLFSRIMPEITVKLRETDFAVEMVLIAVFLGRSFIDSEETDPKPAFLALRSAEAAIRERMSIEQPAGAVGASEEIPKGMRRIRLSGPFTMTEMPLWLSIDGFLPAVKALGLINEQRMLEDPPELLVGTVEGKWKVLGILGFNTTTRRVNKAWERWMKAIPEEELKQRSMLSLSFADVHSQWRPPYSQAVELGTM